MEQTTEIYRFVFAPLGGRLCCDKADQWWELETRDFVFHIELDWRYAETGYRLGIGCAISHKELSQVVSRICGDAKNSFKSFKYVQAETAVETLEETEEVYRNMIREKLNEVQSADMQCIIKDFAANCPDRPYMRQIHHLACLAWLGDFTTLTDYEKIFERGFRMNFVPLIDKAMISRAIDVAIERG